MTRRRDHREAGAVLVLVLVFLVAIGPILAALVTLSGSNLLNTNNLETQRNLEFAADTYIDGAIQAVRYIPVTSTPCQTTSAETVAAFPTGTTPASFTPNGEAMAVWCYMGILGQIVGRNTEFAVCATSYTTYSSCVANYILDVHVIYNDSASYGGGVNIVTWTLKTASR